MKSLSQRDKKVIWHPFTQSKGAAPEIPIVKGKGVMIIDDEGNEYIDAVSSWWVNVHGHSHPYIKKKIAKQLSTLEHVIFAGFTHPWAIELAERIIKLNPAKHKKVFFSDNGSTAVEVGFKMALQYWWNIGKSRKKIIAFEDGYHGDTLGAMSVGGRGIFSTPFEDIMFEVHHIPTPNGKNNEAVIKQFKALLKTGDIAAFIYEPIIQGSGGMNMYCQKGMNKLLKLARKKEVILIADEVMTGFGRTGKLFASEYYDTQPDIMTLSKALTGGTMPLSLTTCRSYIYDAFVSDDKIKTFFHGHSYTGNPTACSAALASLDLMEKKQFKKNIKRVYQQHKDFSKQLKKFKNVKNVRLIGTILAFDIVTGQSDDYFNSIRGYLYKSFIQQKVLLRPLGNTVYVLPPYVITNKQLKKVYQAIENTLNGFEAA